MAAAAASGGGSNEKVILAKRGNRLPVYDTSDFCLHFKRSEEHRHEGLYRGYKDRDELDVYLLTKKGDKYIQCSKESILALGIDKGFFKLPVFPRCHLLWIGSELDDLSHLSNIVGPDGLVYCSYPSCSAGAEVGSTNIVDIAGDISMLLNDDLKTTRDSMEKVDAVYMDSEVLHTSRTADPFFRSEVDTLVKVMKLDFVKSTAEFFLVLHDCDAGKASDAVKYLNDGKDVYSGYMCRLIQKAEDSGNRLIKKDKDACIIYGQRKMG